MMFKPLIIICAASCVLTTHAQLMIDRAGGRDVLFKEEISSTNRLRLRFDSGEKSVSATYLGYALTNWFPKGNFVIGARAKAAATDGWDEFLRFERLPGIEAYEHASNYKDLSKVDVTDVSQTFPLATGGVRQVSGASKAVRLGSLNEFNAFPLNAVVTFDVGVPRSVYQNLHILPEHDAYGLIFAPYVEITPRDEGKPTHAVGIQFTLRRKEDYFKAEDERKNAKPGEKPKDGPLEQVSGEKPSAFPISVFVERRNAFGLKPETKVGIAAVYSF